MGKLLWDINQLSKVYKPSKGLKQTNFFPLKRKAFFCLKFINQVRDWNMKNNAFKFFGFFGLKFINQVRDWNLIKVGIFNQSSSFTSLKFINQVRDWNSPKSLNVKNFFMKKCLKFINQVRDWNAIKSKTSSDKTSFFV